MMYVISTFLPYFFPFLFKFFLKNFKFRRNFLKFTAGMGYRLVAVSGNFAGNQRLPTGKVNIDRKCTVLAFSLRVFQVL